MAAVRCAARRLGGSLLQRTQAAVAEEGRLLTPSRLMRSRQLSSEVSGEGTQAAAAEEQRRRLMRSRQLSSKARAHSARQTQQKELELYDLLSKANERHLSGQATAKRPFDPRRWNVYSERARAVLDVVCKVIFFVYGGAFLLGITGAGKMLGITKEVTEDKIKK